MERRIDQWGTPHERGAVDEKIVPLQQTKICQIGRCEIRHVKCPLHHSSFMEIYKNILVGHIKCRTQMKQN